MDITDLLTNDHAEVNQLFERFEQADDAEQQDQIGRKVVHELSVHAAVEEQFVYPLVRMQAQRGGKLADIAIEEHAQLKQHLSDLEKQEAGTAEYGETMGKVIAAVRQHVEEEEGTIFPELRSATEADTREKVASIVENAKGLVPTHPHPLVPGTATAQLVAGPWAAVVDKVRDLLGAGPR
jgi:hemerythrin superfamily protein